MAKPFTIDLTKGMSRRLLKARYLELVRAVGDLENCLLFLAAENQAAVTAMPEPYRAKVQNLLKAYED